MQRKTVYTFWEPRGSMPAYVELCMKTWATHLSGWEIVVLDHQNLAEHVGEGILDLDALRMFRPATQKDAIEAAVLHRNGGVFMDADTIVVGPLDPITRHLERSELVLFSLHLAFAAARPGGALLDAWLNEVQRRLSLAVSSDDGVPDSWGYLGNEIVADTMTDMVSRTRLLRSIDVTGAIRAWRKQDAPAGEHRLSRLRRRAQELFIRGVRRAVFLATCREQLIMLNRSRYGFIAEARHFGSSRMGPEEQYERFWFNDSIDTAAVCSARPSVIGLHNSWTPSWYAQLSASDVLAHPCLLSRTLRRVLG